MESWESLEALTEAISSAIDADPQPLLNQYQAFITSSNPPGPSTLILASTQPILSPNKNSWSGDFLSQLNFENVTLVAILPSLQKKYYKLIRMY